MRSHFRLFWRTQNLFIFYFLISILRSISPTILFCDRQLRLSLTIEGIRKENRQHSHNCFFFLLDLATTDGWWRYTSREQTTGGQKENPRNMYNFLRSASLISCRRLLLWKLICGNGTFVFFQNRFFFDRQAMHRVDIALTRMFLVILNPGIVGRRNISSVKYMEKTSQNSYFWSKNLWIGVKQLKLHFRLHAQFLLDIKTNKNHADLLRPI